MGFPVSNFQMAVLGKERGTRGNLSQGQDSAFGVCRSIPVVRNGWVSLVLCHPIYQGLHLFKRSPVSRTSPQHQSRSAQFCNPNAEHTCSQCVRLPSSLPLNVLVSLPEFLDFSHFLGRPFWWQTEGSDFLLAHALRKRVVR